MRRGALCLLVVSLLLSCGGDDTTPSGPNPGPLELRLSGPVGAGAVLLVVEGGTIDSVEAGDYFMASTIYSGVARRVLVVGQNLDGVLARVAVPDRRVDYRATILEIADGATYRLRDPAAYTVRVIKP